jgi:hypothetical protein
MALGCKPRPAQIFSFQNQLVVLNLMALGLQPRPANPCFFLFICRTVFATPSGKSMFFS